MYPFKRVAEFAALSAGTRMVLLGCYLAAAAQFYQQALGTEASVALVPSTSKADQSGRPPLPAGSVAVLRCPRLVKGLFVLPDTGDNLVRGPVWVAPNPGVVADGNVIIAAHRDTHFRFLKDVGVGDMFELDTKHGHFTYAVDQLNVIQKEDRELLGNHSENVLTLITCYPFYFIGAAPQRFVVRAHLVSRHLRDTTGLHL